jgi:16S rRNA G966 N2-methylase RsmD
VLVERDPRAARRLHRWLEEAEATAEARVLVRDAGRDALPAGPFDIVFFDPPYPAWEGEEARGALARAVERLAEGGVVVAKIPAARAIPGDPRWREVRRTPVGYNAWVLVRAAPAPR